MAVTQYQIFCRYVNESVNRALANTTSVDWVGAEEWNELQAFYKENKTEYNNIKARILSGETRETQLSVQELLVYEQGKKYEEIQDKVEKKQIAIEYCILEPHDSLYEDTTGTKRKSQMARDLELYDYVTKETTGANPKYGMVFVYDGIAYGESRTGRADYNPTPLDDRQIPYVYYDRMKRIQLDPWFLFSTHASLNSAMAKAKELVNVLGKEAVKIGKVVPLDQYIEIV